MTRTRRRLAAALLTAVAGGAVGLAQTGTRPAEPAARLLPAQPVDSAVVSRGYAPEPGTFGDLRPPVTTSAERRSWTGAPLPADARRQPTSTPAPASTPVSAEPRRQPTPAPATVPAPAGPPAYATGSGGVYAGPPAYRWYGYGTTTPGANPLAPAGQYPKGSANWYAQTGATPGAFPVPVTAGGEPLPRFEPPAYAAATVPPPAPPRIAPTSPVPTYPATVRETRPVPSFVPPTQPVSSRPVSASPPRPTVVPPSTPAATVVPPAPTEPPQAHGEPKPIAVSSAPAPAVVPVPPAVAEKKAEPPAPSTTPAVGLSWQAAPGTKESLTFTAARAATPASVAAPPPSPATPPKDEPAPISFKPSVPAPSVAPPAPSVPPVVYPPLPAAPAGADWKAAPQARGQQPTDEPVSLTQQLRSACYGLATVAEVTSTGPTALTVKLAAASEADARSAAAQAAKLPALRPYTVRFEVVLPAGR